MHKWRLLISINLISLDQRNEPHHKKEPVKSVIQPRFRDVGQTHTEWQTKLTAIYLSLLILIIVPRSSLVMSFIFLIDEIKFMPISSRHFCIRGCNVCLFCWNYFAISSWTKRLTLDLKILIKFWRQRGNGAVEVSLESRTAQMSTFTFWYSLS